MTHDQLEFADDCIHKLKKSFPHSSSISHWHNDSNYSDAELVLKILKDEGWIEYSGVQYKLCPNVISVLEKHNSYSKHVKYTKSIELRNEKKQIYNFHTAKWKYHTFWWFFGLAVFGGVYSISDFTIKITKYKNAPKEQFPIRETELEESKSHTLILDQKSLDSLRNSKIQPDSLKIK